MRWLRTFLLVSALSVMPFAGVASASDFTGHWRNEGDRLPGLEAPIVVLAQSGDQISVTYELTPPFAGSLSYTGALVGERLRLVPVDPPEAFPNYPLDFRYSAPDTLSISYFWSQTTNSLRRCECWDGNTQDGDGCDSLCRVEECHQCTPEPSNCTVMADGSTCDDNHDCTTGEQCSGGACGGGSAVHPCIDLTGKWLRVFVWNDTHSWGGDNIHEERPRIQSTVSDVVQREGLLTFSGNSPVASESFGEARIDSATGELVGLHRDDWPRCAPEFLYGQTGAGGVTYEGLGEVEKSYLHIGGCTDYDHASERAFRCGGGVVDTGEKCLVESCQACTGEPAVCGPLPDGTPCNSNDPCAQVSTCLDGTCVATVSDSCPTCMTCDGHGGCVTAPRTNCRVSTDPQWNRLVVKQRSDRSGHMIRWNWSYGEAFGRSDLAHPEVDHWSAMCVFDESGPAPVLLARKAVPPGFSTFCGPPYAVYGDCYHYAYGGSYRCAHGGGCLWDTGGTPGWSFPPNGDAEFVPSPPWWDADWLQTDVRRMRVRTGHHGKTSTQLRAKGTGSLGDGGRLPLPLRVQFQFEGGICLDASFGEAGVQANGAGKFFGKGTN